jgi:hypothetical protein
MEQPITIYDVLEIGTITQSLAIACCDPKVLVQLSLTQSDLHSMISQSGLAAEIARELHRHGASWAKGCKSLEELSMGIDVEGICSQNTKNHLYFQYGGGTNVRPLSKPLLDSAALLGRRYRQLQFQVDAHVGQTAPAGAATMTAQARATAIMVELGNRGLVQDRVSMRAWGRKVSSAWQEEEEDETAARAELFFRLGGVEFPLRDAYYDLVPEDKKPPIGTIEEPSDDEDDDERLVQLPDGQVLPLSLLRACKHKHQGEQHENDRMCLEKGLMGSSSSTERHVFASVQNSQIGFLKTRQVSAVAQPKSPGAQHAQPKSPVVQPKSPKQGRDFSDVASDSSSLDSEELDSYFFNFVPMTRQTTVAALVK